VAMVARRLGGFALGRRTLRARPEPHPESSRGSRAPSGR